MCGIAGFVSQSLELHDLRLMLANLAHRGPDGFGTYRDSHAALGSTRLAIVDLEGGNQPVFSAEGDVALVFNGEVYNYPELRQILKSRGRIFNGESDAEVLLQSYLEHGESFAAELNGQFAIAIWDGRKRKMILVRDRFGVRPLFYLQTPEFFAFSSEIKSLLTLPKVPRRFNEKALDQLFQFWTPIGSHTFFSDIYELLPGHMLIQEKGTSRISSYWHWPFPSLVQGTSHSYEEEFTTRLHQAVKLRLRSDVEVAAYLSGGLDSSAIVALASRSLATTLRTFSLSFTEKSYDEGEAQQKISELFRTRHSTITCRDEDIERHFESTVWHAEAPIFRTAPAPLFLLSKLVRENNIKVVLTGEGADEILLGYDLFRELKIRMFWARQPESAWRPLLLKRIYAYLPHFRNPRYANLAIQSFRGHLQDDGPFYSHLIRWTSQAVNKCFFSESLKNRLENYEATVELKTFLPEDYFRASALDKAQYLELVTLLKGYLLSSQGDRMSMAHSVESRYPFLDHQFVTYVNGLSSKTKLASLRDKAILRNAMKGILPEDIRTRPKFAYQAPEIRPFIPVQGKRSRLIDQYLNSDAIQKAGLYDEDLVQALLSKAANSDQSRLGMRDNSAFIQILSTQIFYEHYFVPDFRKAAERKLEDLRIPFRVQVERGTNMASLV